MSEDDEMAAFIRARVHEDAELALMLMEMAQHLGESLRSMAAIWQGHSDFKQEWKP